jgi:predicted nucleic acid-binding protein
VAEGPAQGFRPDNLVARVSRRTDLREGDKARLLVALDELHSFEPGTGESVEKQEWEVAMTRFVVDASAAVKMAAEELVVSADHELLAPTLLRSQTLSLLHEAVHRGDLTAAVARERLQRIWRMPIRLLGDVVLRRSAWEVAERMGWAGTYTAEYVALTQLHAEALVTADAEVARSVEGVVPVASIDALREAA